MNNTSINPSAGRCNGYRMLTFLIPLNAPTTAPGRQRNLKLRHLLRWFAYGFCRFGWCYYRMSPKSDARLQYGALCVSCKRFCKKEKVVEQAMVQELLHRLHAENLCSALYILDDNGEGEASLIAGIPVAGNAVKSVPLAVKVAELNGEEVFGGGHVPYFARQGLRNMADRPVAAYSDTLTDYDAQFG
ncbi:MAG: hypothetical protein IJ498_07200 [Akkermansia sp.]|nr:hypothetical protein [Akkermansia sp.]